MGLANIGRSNVMLWFEFPDYSQEINMFASIFEDWRYFGG
jgi:hypothetical protein